MYARSRRTRGGRDPLLRGGARARPARSSPPRGAPRPRLVVPKRAAPRGRNRHARRSGHQYDDAGLASSLRSRSGAAAGSARRSRRSARSPSSMPISASTGAPPRTISTTSTEPVAEVVQPTFRSSVNQARRRLRRERGSRGCRPSRPSWPAAGELELGREPPRWPARVGAGCPEGRRDGRGAEALRPLGPDDRRDRLLAHLGRRPCTPSCSTPTSRPAHSCSS